MELILFRHGEKQAAGADPELTELGKNQAKAIVRLVENKNLPQPTQIIVSPRRRALQTLEPLAKWSRLRTKTNPELDQQLPTENSKDFRLRVQEFLVSLALEEKSTDIVYLCSHHDWVIEFLSVIESDTDFLGMNYMHWGPAQFMHFEKKDIWHMIKFGKA